VKENRVIRKLKYYRLSQFSKEGGIGMPVVRIDLWKGRDKEKKKELRPDPRYKEIRKEILPPEYSISQ